MEAFLKRYWQQCWRRAAGTPPCDVTSHLPAEMSRSPRAMNSSRNYILCVFCVIIKCLQPESARNPDVKSLRCHFSLPSQSRIPNGLVTTKLKYDKRRITEKMNEDKRKKTLLFWILGRNNWLIGNGCKENLKTEHNQTQNPTKEAKLKRDKSSQHWD